MMAAKINSLIQKAYTCNQQFFRIPELMNNPYIHPGIIFYFYVQLRWPNAGTCSRRLYHIWIRRGEPESIVDETRYNAGKK